MAGAAAHIRCPVRFAVMAEQAVPGVRLAEQHAYFEIDA